MTFEVWLSCKGDLGQYSWNLVKACLTDSETANKTAKTEESKQLRKEYCCRQKKWLYAIVYIFLMYEYFWFKGAKLENL